MQTESSKDCRRAKSPASSKLQSIVSVKVVGDFVLRMELSSGRLITRDFNAFVLCTKGVLERLCDPKFFNKVRIVDGALAWPGSIEFNPLRTIYGKNWTTSRRILSRGVF